MTASYDVVAFLIALIMFAAVLISRALDRKESSSRPVSSATRIAELERECGINLNGASS